MLGNTALWLLFCYSASWVFGLRKDRCVQNNAEIKVLLVGISSIALALEYDAEKGTGYQQYQVGMRVKVPYRNKDVVAVIIATGVSPTLPANKRKRIHSRLDRASIFQDKTSRFLHKVAAYYHVSPAQVYTLCFCKNAWSDTELLQKWRQTYVCNLQHAQGVVLTKPQQKLVKRLQDPRSTQVEYADCIMAGCKQEVIHQLIGMQVLSESTTWISPWATRLRTTPSDKQLKVIQSITMRPTGYQYHYLYGVTGSGKTCVYSHVAKAWLKDPQQTVLWLVPEISITPKLIEEMVALLGTDHVVSYHSGLTEKKRYLAWLNIVTGRARLVIGTRSSIFLPIPKLAGIIMDEEHDASYKQQSGLRYSTRGVACLRAKAEDVPILLGSATPSLRCLAQRNKSGYPFHTLTVRYGAASLPVVRLLAMEKHVSSVGIASRLLAEIARTLSQGKQVLLFLNRRGFAPCWWCSSCESVQCCPSCDRPYTFHQAKNTLSCHRCERVESVNKGCANCGSNTCIPLGHGTEKVARYLREQFGDFPVLQIDRDTCGTWKKMQESLGQVYENKPQILVATQMLIKSHHIPNLETVIVLDADQAFQSRDFRALENLSQQMHQVIGRAGREGHEGVVYIQTFYQDHPFWDAIVRHNYLEGATYLLSERKAACLPPYSLQAACNMRHRELQQVKNNSQSLWQLLTNAKLGVHIYHPMPATLLKQHGWHFYTLVIQAQSMAALSQAVSLLQQTLASHPALKRVHYTIDIDPVTL